MYQWGVQELLLMVFLKLATTVIKVTIILKIMIYN